jgi:hypothetical protein
MTFSPMAKAQWSTAVIPTQESEIGWIANPGQHRQKKKKKARLSQKTSWEMERVKASEYA